MKEKEFDKIAENLDDLVKEGLGIFAKYRELILAYKAEYLKFLLHNEPRTILDFGCGVGLQIPYFKEYLPNAKIYGCDVSGKSIMAAQKKYSDCDLSVIDNVGDLEQYKGKIDCVFISAVLHHIPPEEHEYRKGICKYSIFVFFPWRNRFFIGIERILGWLPLGAQYIVVVKK